MKKVLIYMPINKLKPTGGPAGYLYNLNNALKNMETNIEFLPAVKENVKKEKIKKMLPQNINLLLRAIKLSKLLKKSSSNNVDFNNYDVIHFHSTEDLYKCRKKLESYNGKVVLTSHSPCALHVEFKNSIPIKFYKIFKKKIDGLEKMDKDAFKRANFVIFPCKEAEEPYFNSWKKYSSIRDESKIKYLYTGINPCKAKISADEYRKENNYDKKDFIICYVGRHNRVKGYDNFLNIGLEAIDKLNVKVIVAGKQEPLKGPQNNNWNEVGWTNDPHSIINSADVFVLPNKETYFDLIMLEVLSLGKIILTTYTGGNKIFEKFENSGIFYYDGINDCLEKIKMLKNLDKNDKEKLEKRNKEIFTNNFNNEIFARNYIKLIEEL